MMEVCGCILLFMNFMIRCKAFHNVILPSPGVNKTKDDGMNVGGKRMLRDEIGLLGFCYGSSVESGDNGES